MDKLEFLEQTESRLRAAGYEVETWPDDLVTGVRSDFRLRWAASRLHTVVVVSAADTADAAGMEQFTNRALAWANARKGQLNGLQSGVAVIAVVGAERVDDTALPFARKRIVQFAAFAWPVVVDLATGASTSHAGRPLVGAVFNGWMRKQVAAVAGPARKGVRPASAPR